MKKVNRLGWTVGLALTAYGTSVGIRTNDASIIDRLPEYLPPEWEESDNPVVETLFSLRVGPPSTRKGRRNYHLLYLGAGRAGRSLELDDIFKVLESRITIIVAYWAHRDYLFVHSGVVGWRGQAIVIPARSFSGKTTLVAELIKAGATYYSDDMAVFSPDGRVHPYPVPLAVRYEDRRQKYAPEAFGSHVGQEPLPVGQVVITRYAEGASWRPRVLTPGRAMMALLDNTVAARKDPKVSLPILHQVVSTATSIKSKRGEAVDVVRHLLR